MIYPYDPLTPENIQDKRMRGFVYLGGDGEMQHFSLRGYIYSWHFELGWVGPTSILKCLYTRATSTEGWDHMTIHEFYAIDQDHQHYCELAEYIYPGQWVSWTLPVDQEC